MPVNTSKQPTIPERLASAAFHLEEARRHNMEAAQALHADLIPSEFGRDVLFAMDAARESLVRIADFAAALDRPEVTE
jgi:hypothetical protein